MANGDFPLCDYFNNIFWIDNPKEPTPHIVQFYHYLFQLEAELETIARLSDCEWEKPVIEMTQKLSAICSYKANKETYRAPLVRVPFHISFKKLDQTNAAVNIALSSDLLNLS